MFKIIRIPLSILLVLHGITSQASPLPTYFPAGQIGLFADNEGKIHGLDSAAIQKTFSKAGIDVSYESATFPRIELEMASNNPSCAAAIIKTPKRLESGVQFVLRFKWNLILNVYEKIGASTVPKNIPALAPYASSIYTFGSTAEQLLDENKIGYKSGMNLDDALRMLKLDRIMFVAASSLSVEASSEYADGKIGKVLKLGEVNAYLACSRGTSKSTVQALKRAAKQLKTFIVNE
jgi:hypothetical protein